MNHALYCNFIQSVMMSTVAPSQTYSAVCVLLLKLIFMITMMHSANQATFTEAPSSQVVGVGQEAMFRCRIPNALSYGWIWNGSGVIDPPPGIIPDNNILTIIAQSNYNETEVVCVAFFINGEPMRTTPVRLLIQGPLHMVTSVTRSASTITWKAPFSLNLTNVDPNIVYCVKVYNITCGVDDLIVSDCNVAEPSYEDNRLHQGHIYRISITPRSNGENAQNGTNETKEEIFAFLIDPRTSVSLADGLEEASASIQLRNDGTTDGEVEPASYSLFLSSIDGTNEPPNNVSLATSFKRSVDTVTLNVSRPLPRGRLWNYQVLALGCNEHPITNLQELSSHDFQNISVSSSIPGGVTVAGDFISDSLAIGILVIVYANDSNVRYEFIPRSEIPMAFVTSLPDGRYEVSVYVVEENGSPFRRSATIPRNVSLLEGSGLQSFKYELFNTTEDTVCVNCTFQDSIATACVAVVHQRISQLGSSGLMNIESSHKFNRSGDIAYGCIEGINMTAYLIGVFSLIETMSTATPGEHGGLNSVTIGLIVLGILLLVLLIAVLIFVIIVVCCKKIRLRLLSLIQAIREHMTKKKSGDSTTLQRLTTDSSKPQAQDEVAYDVLHRGKVKPSPVAAKEEGALEYAAIYNVLDQHPPQSGVMYSSVELGPSSGLVGYDDLHKTQYSTLQQEAQEESSFNEGAAAGNADNRNTDTTQNDMTYATSESQLNSFQSIKDPTMALELITLVGDDEHVFREEAYFTGYTVTISRSRTACIKEWQHKDLVLPGSRRLGKLSHFD